MAYSFFYILPNEEGLFNYDPHLMEYIVGDGNCYFSTISYLITGSKGFHLDIRTLIVENMLGKLSMSCNKYLRTKYVYTQGNYRNVQDWVNKMGMNKNKNGLRTWRFSQLTALKHRYLDIFGSSWNTLGKLFRKWIKF